jgi:hypothetical protein
MAGVAASALSTSGALVLGLRTYVERLHGDDAFPRVLERLDAESAAPFQQLILPQRRYPTASYVAALDAASAAFDDPDFYDHYGEWLARYSINGLFRFVLRLHSPGWVLDRGLRIWRTFHDSGEWEVEVSDHSFRGALRGFAVVNGGYCRSIAGWIRGAAKLTGIRNANVAHPECTAIGAKRCLFVADWPPA